MLLFHQTIILCENDLLRFIYIFNFSGEGHYMSTYSAALR